MLPPAGLLVCGFVMKYYEKYECGKEFSSSMCNVTGRINFIGSVGCIVNYLFWGNSFDIETADCLVFCLENPQHFTSLKQYSGHVSSNLPA